MLRLLLVYSFLIAATPGFSLGGEDPDREYQVSDELFERGEDVSPEDYDNDDLELRHVGLYPGNVMTERGLDDDDDDDDDELYARELEEDDDQDPESLALQKRRRRRKTRKPYCNVCRKCRNGRCEMCMGCRYSRG